MHENEQIIASIETILASKYVKNILARVDAGVESFSLTYSAIEHLILVKALLEKAKK